VLQAIRGKPGLSGIPIGIVTTSDALKDRHRVALIGSARYIHKPARLEEFTDQVDNAIKELLTGPNTQTSVDEGNSILD
jgi:DNA-binding response OmpR family regulator